MTILQTGANTTTDEAGRFRFGFLPPDVYALQVQALGYHANTLGVAVFVGEVSEISVVLASKPSDSPYSELIILRGFWYCGFQYVVAGLYCATLTLLNQTGPILNRNIFEVPFAAGWNETVFEQVWNRNAGITTSGRAYTYIATWNETTKTLDGPPRETVKGPSPMVVRFYPGFQGYEWLNAVTVRPKPGPFPADVKRVQYAAFLQGLLTNETQSAYPEQPGAPNQGVGGTVQTPFQIFSAQFYYQRSPPRYSSQPDA